MISLVEEVAPIVDPRCIARRGLSKEGCTVVMTGVSRERLVIDFDKPGSPLQQDSTRCDYLCIVEADNGDDWIVPLELKKGGFKANAIAQQLQAGANVADRLVSTAASFRFRAVAFSGTVRKAERLSLKRQRVEFRGRREEIRRTRCGDRLASVLR